MTLFFPFLEYSAFLPDLLRDGDGDVGHFPGDMTASLLMLRHHTDPGPLPRIRLWIFRSRHQEIIFDCCAAKCLRVN